MSHYAKVLDGRVIQVICAEADFFNHFVDSSPGAWIQTSYNTIGNVHHNADGQPDEGVALRGNYAGVGYTYDQAHDVFYPAKPYPSWTLDQSKWQWAPPVAYPTDGQEYKWNENTISWDLI